VSTSAHTVLYRPVGQKEFELVRDSGFTRFPPRLPEQPIFYPVATEEYAVTIARDWNASAPGETGYVIGFRIEAAFLDRYEPHKVGGAQHLEYWIPAEDLDDFNDHIVGAMEVLHVFHGRDRDEQDVPGHGRPFG